MQIIEIYQGENRCTKCLGWKRVDNGEGLSWKYWEELPDQSRLAVSFGLVKPIECPHCRGVGQELSRMESIQISKEKLADLPDYTIGSPKEIEVGARWKIYSGSEVFVGEQLPEAKAILKIAIDANGAPHQTA